MFYVRLACLCVLGLLAAVQVSSASFPTRFKKQLKCILGEKRYANIRHYGCVCRKPDKRKDIKPVDSLDECCKLRRDCIKEANCEVETKYNLKLMCEEKKAKKKVDCSGNKQGGCPHVCCTCERKATLCLKRTFKHYKKRFNNLPKDKRQKLCVPPAVKTTPKPPTTPSTKKPKPSRPPKTTPAPTPSTKKPRPSRPPKTTPAPTPTTPSTKKPRPSRPPKTTPAPTPTTPSTKKPAPTPTPPPPGALEPKPAEPPEPKDGEYCGDVTEEFYREHIIDIIIKRFVGRRPYPPEALYGGGGSVNTTIAEELIHINVANLAQFYPWFLCFEVKGVEGLEILLLMINGQLVEARRLQNPYEYLAEDRDSFAKVTLPLPQNFSKKIVAIQIIFSNHAVVRNLFVGICFTPINPIDAYAYFDDATTGFVYPG